MLCKQFTKVIISLGIICLLFNISPCKANAHSEITVDNNDLIAIIYAKIVWQMSFIFIEIDNDNGNYTIVNSFSVVSKHCFNNIKKVYVSKANLILQIDEKEINSGYSAHDLKRMSLNSAVFREILTTIDTNFFDLSNRDKCSVMEKYIKTH